MSSVQIAANGAGLAATESKTSTKDSKDMMGKDAFLQLLVTQLRYQDPMSPMDDKQFISQMAQFTALEQSQNINGQIERLNALAMLGRTVTVQPEDSEDPVVGVVERVVTENGVSKVSVQGRLFTTGQVSAVE